MDACLQALGFKSKTLSKQIRGIHFLLFLQETWL